MIVIGIDPGLTGGLAAIDGLKFRAGARMPTFKVGSKTIIDAGAVEQFFVENPPSLFVIEDVMPMPRRGPGGKVVQMGTTSSFAFGRALGAVEALAHAYVASEGGSVRYVTPAVWKRWAKIGKAKKESTARAAGMFGARVRDQHFAKGVENGIAEAALIAAYGTERWKND